MNSNVYYGSGIKQVVLPETPVIAAVPPAFVSSPVLGPVTPWHTLNTIPLPCIPPMGNTLESALQNRAAWARFYSFLEVHHRKQLEQHILARTAPRPVNNASVRRYTVTNPHFNNLQTYSDLQKTFSAPASYSNVVQSSCKVDFQSSGNCVEDKKEVPVKLKNFLTVEQLERKVLLENLSGSDSESLAKTFLDNIDKDDSISEPQSEADTLDKSSSISSPDTSNSQSQPLFYELLRSSEDECKVDDPADQKELIRREILKQLQMNSRGPYQAYASVNNGYQQGKRRSGYSLDRQGYGVTVEAKRARPQAFYSQAVISPAYYTHVQAPMGSSSVPKVAPVNRTREIAKITECIQKMYNQKKQTLETYQRKMNLHSALLTIVQELFPYCGLYVVGSSMNGFGSVHSDMDMCLLVQPNKIIPKKEAVEWLKEVQVALKKCTFLKQIQVIKAKVPIIKFRDSYSGVECDINVNNEIGIRNTHLLNAYSKLDERVKPLVLFVKLWAKYHNINDASQSTLSSYSLTMMVIHYLQCGCNPPALPSLQRKYPHLFSNSSEVKDLTLQQQLPAFNSPNHQSLGEHLMGFFKYYAEVFDFRKDVASVRLAQKLSLDTVMQGNKQAKAENQWKFISIEEPFDLSNIARSVHNVHKFQRIFHVFKVSLRVMRQTGKAETLFENPL